MLTHEKPGPRKGSSALSKSAFASLLGGGYFVVLHIEQAHELPRAFFRRKTPLFAPRGTAVACHVVSRGAEGDWKEGCIVVVVLR